jgi:hypothetical protein
MRATSTVSLLAAALAVASGCGAAGRASPPCAAGGCGAGRACVAGLCRPAEGGPAQADSSRVLLAPKQLAVVSAHGDGGGGARLPDAFALGRGADGAVVVLLAFEPTWRDDVAVESAFVLLDPLDGGRPAGGGASIDVARVLDPWDPSTVSWGRQPRTTLPALGAIASPRPAPPVGTASVAPAIGGFGGPAATTAAAFAALDAARAPLRVDVTALVRAWSRHRGDDHGIALFATGDDAFGATYATGRTRGRPPRLEVYLR